VRDMMDSGGVDGDGVATLLRERQRLLRGHDSTDEDDVPAEREETHGQVVFGRATTYVGATHFMAMLDDASTYPQDRYQTQADVNTLSPRLRT